MDETRKSSLSYKCATFLVKLHAILSRSDCQHIITWLPHGHSWRILQPMLLETKIIPLYFRYSNLSSFMRQVNGWGFQRLYKNGNESSYHHKVRFLFSIMRHEVFSLIYLDILKNLDFFIPVLYSGHTKFV